MTGNDIRTILEMDTNQEDKIRAILDLAHDLAKAENELGYDTGYNAGYGTGYETGYDAGYNTGRDY